MVEEELQIVSNLTGIDPKDIKFSDDGFLSRGYIIDDGRIVSHGHGQTVLFKTCFIRGGEAMSKTRNRWNEVKTCVRLLLVL